MLSVFVDLSNLADGHLLDHLGLAGGGRAASGGCAGLLLKDLPELEGFIGSWVC